MDHKLRSVIESGSVVLLGTAGAFLIGRIGFTGDVFQWRNPAFQFLTFGFGSAFLATICRQKGFLTSLLYVLPLAAVCSIPARKLFWYGFINAALFFGFAATIFETFWEKLRHRLPFGKFVLLGVLFAIFELCKTPLLALAIGAQDTMAQTQLNVLLRGTLGLGLGLGIEVGEWIVSRYMS